ncbi:MAG: hypothetical protein PHV68_04755, partial [Candidatus Gastranaerophilales bacterium]|nr:hypothetical protein [Candidatus Gastranaerophilales bacterium]
SAFVILIISITFLSLWFAKISISDKIKLNSVSKTDVVIISSLRNSSYKNYIQSVYVNPKEKNQLIILIKPVYWNVLTTGEKESMLNIVNKKWNKIFKEKHTKNKNKPYSTFANK